MQIFVFLLYINKAIKNSTKQGRSKHPEVLSHKHYILVVKLNLKSPIKMPQSEFKDMKQTSRSPIAQALYPCC